MIFKEEIFAAIDVALSPDSKPLFEKSGSLHKSCIYRVFDKYIVKISWPVGSKSLSFLVDEPIIMAKMPESFTPRIYWWGLRDAHERLAVVIVMDFISGVTLESIFSSCFRMDAVSADLSDLLSIKDSLLTYRVALSRLGICHRDIRPKNVIYDFAQKKCYFIDYALSSSFADCRNKTVRRSFTTFDGLAFDINDDNEAIASLVRTVNFLILKKLHA